MGEQTNPWKLLHLQDTLSRPNYSPITRGLDYIFRLKNFYKTTHFKTYWRIVRLSSDLILSESVSTGSRIILIYSARLPTVLT